MQSIFLFFLGALARFIVRIKKPYIIGVTGTVGKTTITSHIATLLRHEYGAESVMFSSYHYNGEFGLPLSIIGAKTGGKNPFRWIFILFLGFTRCVTSYPKYLILEYGIDHPGEMDFLLSIAIPDIAIISSVSPNHLEQFVTFASYRGEKLLLAKYAKYLIIHESLRQYIDREALFYSMGGMSDIDASHMHMSISGVSAQIHLKEMGYTIQIPAFGAYQIENILPVYGIASFLGIDPLRISECSPAFLPEPGRSSILEGKGNSVIIDGSYNGGYESLCRGIDSVLPFATTHRILFFIGDMRELGEHTEKIHTNLAHYILDHVERHHDIEFFLVGSLMQQYVAPHLEGVYPVMCARSSRVLGLQITSLLEQGGELPTIIYVKGSQNTIFLEEGIKSFLAHMKDASLLCRQSRDWIRKKDLFFGSLKVEGSKK